MYLDNSANQEFILKDSSNNQKTLIGRTGSQQNSSMNFQNFQNEANDFRSRIIQAFKLKDDQGKLIQHKRLIVQWIRKKQQDFQNQKKAKQTQNIITALLKKTQIEEKRKKLEKEILLHQRLKTFLKTRCPQEIGDLQEFAGEQLFREIKQSLLLLLENQVQQYYGYVKAPLIGNMYISKKQDFKSNVQNSPNHNLKFIVSQSKVAHKYQRNLVQQVFGRVIRKKGALSLMIKVQIDVLPDQKDIDLYCYIQDLSFKGQQYKPLSEVQLREIASDQFVFQIRKDKNETIQINKQSILQIFLSQMIVIPVQTLVSDFIIQISNERADIIKYHQGTREQIGESTLLKDHPSIRNPLFYFRDYILRNEIAISQILKFNTKKIYGNFYHSLNIISKLVVDDFSFYLDQHRINSLCFDMQTFYNLWQVIHNLVMISDWVEQVISPIKQSVTIYQIINKFCPMLSQMVNFQGKNFSHYRNHLLNLQADTFMTSYVPKNVIQKYKDVYVSLNNYDDQNMYPSIYDVYLKIFAPIMDDFDLTSCDLYEAIYFLNFVGQNKTFTADSSGEFHHTWGNYKIWKKVYRLKQSEQLPYISLYLDIFGFYMGVDTVEISSKPFISVKNQKQTPQFFKDLQAFVVWMKTNQQKKYHNHLSILFQKAYRYKKYKICNILLNYDILMSEFQGIFQFDQILNQEQTLRKQQLCINMKLKSPQTYRKLKWEELMRRTLKEQAEQTVAVKTVKYGDIYIKRHIYEAMQFSQIQNNISRRDYMFDPERNMIKMSFSPDNDAYFQYTEYPLLRYFYRLFLQKVNKAHLMPNFTAILTDHGVMLHLIESIPNGLNFEKGYNSFSQTDLKNLLDKDELSQSIILSMILMPSKMQLKNIIAVPSDTPNNSIFMIDFKQFYRSNPIQRNQGNYYLKSINCLFSFDQMHKSISTVLIRKYSNLQIMSFVQSLFLQLSKMIKNINQLKSTTKQRNSHQLLGLIFQKSFIINLTERLFKIQHCFLDCLQKNRSISHIDVLSIINPELSYFYQEIIKSSSSLIERQKKLFDEMWRKPFINRCSLIDFFAPSSIVPQPLYAFPNHYRKLCFDGPTENLNALYNQSKKFVIYQDKVEKLSAFHHQTIEYYVRNLDFSKLSAEQRKLAVTMLQQKSKEYLTRKRCLPLNVIKLQDIDIMKASELDFAYERLKEVLLQNIKTNDLQLSSMLKLLESAISIKMKKLIGITSLGQSSYLSFSLELRNLRILSINQCSQLKSIDIKCDALQNVTFRDNQSLQTIYISSCSLKNLDCTGSNKIKLENIGLYILKGLNVLLSDTACGGYLKKLWDQSYSTYVFNILKLLLNRLKQSQIKAIIITTLTKLKILEEQIACTLLGVPSMSKVTNMILKYNYQLQKKVFFKLIDLFFNNENIQNFVATDMNLTNIEQIATYMKENVKGYKNSFKETKINQTIKNNFESFKTIFTYINLHKHYKLHLQGLELDTDEDSLQIIDLLINKRQDLEKVDLLIQGCKISTNLFETIFRRKNVVSLYILESNINNGISSTQSLQNLKQLNIKNTSINNFELLNKLDNLVVLQINSCELPAELTHFFESIGKKINLKILKFTNQRPLNKQISLNVLLDSLKHLTNLAILNLSNNCFNQNQLKLIDQFAEISNIDQLILKNFYEKAQHYDIFQHFLQKSKLRQLTIQFPLNDTQNLKSFIKSLSVQKSILKLFLQTQTQIESQMFSPLNENRTLNTINSNQLIPTWLKKHLKNNTKERSKIITVHKSTGVQFEFAMCKESKFYEYHKLGLSMDGGGIRGLLLATELQYLASEVGYPLHKIFDVIGGTSIGGILALTISTTLDNVHPIMNPLQLKELFTVHGKDIFRKSQIRTFASLYDTKYNPSYLQNLMNTYFKECKLSDTLKQTNCIVTAVNRMNNKDIIFKSTDAILNRDRDFYVKDIARATSAAPTYFPSAQIKNLIASEKYSLIDGGMGMNNPSKLVIDQVKKMAFNSHSENNYFLLSLGTGKLPNQNIPEYAGIKDIAPIIDSFTESAGYFSERDLIQNYKGHFVRVSPLINLPKKQGQLDNTEPHVLKTYQQTGLSAAKDFFSNTIIFGKYRTNSLVQWLRQNTERKYDI